MGKDQLARRIADHQSKALNLVSLQWGMPLMCLLTGGILEGILPDPWSTIVMICSLILSPIIFLVCGIASTEAFEARNAAHWTRQLQQAATSSRPYVLLLRRSTSTQLLSLSPVEQGLDGSGPAGLHAPGPSIFDHRVVDDLDSAVGKWGMLVLVGGRSLVESLHPLENTVILESAGDSWTRVVDRLAQDAMLIIVIPEETEGIRRELLEIVPVHLQRTILYMPPSNSERGDVRKRRWDEVAARLRDKGIRLPEYDPNGAIRALDGSAGGTGAEDLWRFLEKSRALDTSRGGRSCIGRALEAVAGDLIDLDRGIITERAGIHGPLSG